jgi:hypothetical protein
MKEERGREGERCKDDEKFFEDWRESRQSERQAGRRRKEGGK